MRFSQIPAEYTNAWNFYFQLEVVNLVHAPLLNCRLHLVNYLISFDKIKKSNEIGKFIGIL